MIFRGIIDAPAEYPEHENRPSNPLWEGQRPSGPGVGCGIWNKPTPALRATPSMEGIFMGASTSGVRPPASPRIASHQRNAQPVKGKVGSEQFPVRPEERGFRRISKRARTSRASCTHRVNDRNLERQNAKVRIKPWPGGSFASDDESLYEQFSAVCGRARPRHHHAAS